MRSSCCWSFAAAAVLASAAAAYMGGNMFAVAAVAVAVAAARLLLLRYTCGSQCLLRRLGALTTGLTEKWLRIRSILTHDIAVCVLVPNLNCNMTLPANIEG